MRSSRRKPRKRAELFQRWDADAANASFPRAPTPRFSARESGRVGGRSGRGVGFGGIMIRACHCCGLPHRFPERRPPSIRFLCSRCKTPLTPRRPHSLSNCRTAPVATTALLFFPLGVGLPLIQVERFGHIRESSLVDGVASLLASGQWFVGTVVLLCSLVLPLVKLVALLLLSLNGPGLSDPLKSWIYRGVEWSGRWGMLDVLLVAILVAVLKLGDMLTVTAGPGATCFTLCVVFSLIASACFDPHSLWNDGVPPEESS